MGTVAAMAKKKAGKGRAAGPSYVQIRMSGGFRAWLAEFAERERTDLSDLIDRALEHYAQARGMTRPPKR